METTKSEEAKIKPVETSKGFKVIKCPRKILEAATGQIKCVCDDCLSSPDIGYYVAVLNRWLCPKCYERWIRSAKRYQEDIWVEEKNYDFYMKLLKKWER